MIISKTEIIYAIFVATFILGILIIFGNTFSNIVDIIKINRRLYRRDRERSTFKIHLDNLLLSTLGKRISTELYLYATVIIFLSMAITGMKCGNFTYGLAVATIFSAIPYVLLRIRLESKRNKNSFEGEFFIASLLSAYRISYGNIDDALEKMIDEKSISSFSKNIISEILANIRNARNQYEMKHCADILEYSVNTNWSRLVAYNIGIAVTTGIDITYALEDILSQLKEARVLNEERKRLNAEAYRLVLFMVPTSYICTVFISMNFLNINLKTLIENQFFTKEGFMLITVCIFMFISNIGILSIINNRRFDF